MFESDDVGYALIIGRDLMLELGLDISFENKTIMWEGTTIPMRDFNMLRKWNLFKYEMRIIIQEMNEPIVAQEATDQMIKILDSNYRKANIKKVIAGAKHLNDKERTKLYALLIKYEDLFDGTLGE